MNELIGTTGTMILAQGSDVDITAIWGIVSDGGLIAFIFVALWMFNTDRVVSGTTFARVLAERNASHERERTLHTRIEQDVIPLVTEVSRIAQRLLDADRGPRT